jgi:hypothetical protein
MIRVDHPTIPGVSRNVPAKDVARWQRSGWVKHTESDGSSPSRKSTKADLEAQAAERGIDAGAKATKADLEAAVAAHDAAEATESSTSSMGADSTTIEPPGAADEKE